MTGRNASESLGVGDGCGPWGVGGGWGGSRCRESWSKVEHNTAEARSNEQGAAALCVDRRSVLLMVCDNETGPLADYERQKRK
jgi:hypothetical protein